MGRHKTTEFEMARDELMSHIHRCGVLQAAPEQQDEWLQDTEGYLADRFPTLSKEQLGELKVIGERFCKPAIQHGKENTALSRSDTVVESHDDHQDDEPEVAPLAGAV